jgi:hypothetical protein
MEDPTLENTVEHLMVAQRHLQTLCEDKRTTTKLGLYRASLCVEDALRVLGAEQEHEHRIPVSVDLG